uniref:photosystem I n=1 Tax=Helianthus annuus TaxID=4232 RepID=A0A1Y3BTX2_HELAN
MYRTNFGIGHSMKDLLDAHIPPGGRLGRGHKGLYDTINNSIHFQLGLALASLGVITSLVAQHMYSLPAYAFIAQDFTTQAALYTHHNTSQLASLFLGFHTLGLYVHNDVMLAFGTPEKQILIEPIFAQWIQSAHGKTSYGFDILLSSRVARHSMRVEAYGCRCWSWRLFGSSCYCSRFTYNTLILVRCVRCTWFQVNASKKDFGYSFPCDGPGRGGTCDISVGTHFIWQFFGFYPSGHGCFYLDILFWATGFMFLISWRGYWQELIETLAWAHERTPLANLIRWRDKPVALSIVQARLVGLAHFSVGYIFTYAAFLIASTSGKLVNFFH